VIARSGAAADADQARSGVACATWLR
jgi:hypothetical protein